MNENRQSTVFEELDLPISIDKIKACIHKETESP
jgi:hypothetical protein